MKFTRPYALYVILSVALTVLTGCSSESSQNASPTAPANDGDLIDDGSEFFDNDGNFTDDGSEFFADDGNFIDDSEFFDDDGNFIDDSELFDDDGNFIGDGELFDDDGNFIDDGQSIIDNDGDTIDDGSNSIDSNENTIDNGANNTDISDEGTNGSLSGDVWYLAGDQAFAETFRFNLETGETTRFKNDTHAMPSMDGKRYIQYHYRFQEVGFCDLRETHYNHKIDVRDTKTSELLSTFSTVNDHFPLMHLSPDGTRILALSRPPISDCGASPSDRYNHVLYTVNGETMETLRSDYLQINWMPDNRLVAVQLI